MTRLEKSIVAFVAFVIIVAVFFFVTRPPASTPKQAVAILQGDPPPEGGGCSQCLGNNCYSAPCNMDCLPVGSGCETRVAGGAQQEYTPETKKNGGDYAEFSMQRVLKLNMAMEKAGVEIGDTVTRVNDIYAGSDLEFAKLVLKLPKGTRLSLWTSKGEKREVTL